MVVSCEKCKIQPSILSLIVQMLARKEQFYNVACEPKQLPTPALKEPKKDPTSLEKGGGLDTLTNYERDLYTYTLSQVHTLVLI